MKLKTGLIPFPIEFDNGAKETIYINPNDPDLFVRFSEFENRMNERVKNLEDFELTADGTPKNVEFVDAFREIRNATCEELDIAFGNKISDVVCSGNKT